ncbi:MAG: carbonic anhydrase [Campylobacterota bacterium]|nr:carbonic anhydrase [Campylobacterota bacterium]
MQKNSTLMNGNNEFKNSYFNKHESELLDLVENGQHPKALFIGCADSRVVPNLITQTPPGDLFVLRNVGNFVAPYKPDEDYHATASGIEYAVAALKVSEIIICGHTHCGAIASLYSDIDDTAFIHTKKWLSLGEKAKSLATLSVAKNDNKEELLRLTEKFSVIFQIENLLTYPLVKKGVDEGTLHIHGWIYDMENGDIEYYDPEDSTYKSLEKLGANKDD